MSAPRRLGPAARFAHVWISSKLTPLLIAAALLVGAFAVWKLPREEEPQIIVPMIDVMVQMPGASAREVEERVTKPMEKLLWEIPGVEYIYSTSSPGSSLAIVRFYVGQDEEKSLVRLNQKMYANFELIPPGCSQPLVKPRSIDDVPILALTLSSQRYGDFELRRIAAQSAAKSALCSTKPSWRRTTSRRSRWPARSACPTAVCPPASSRAGTASTCSKPVSSCAPPKMCGAWWLRWPTTSRYTFAT
jgi:hypothetical protein